MSSNTTLAPTATRVLDMLQDGKTAKEIADELDTSRNAVYQHIGKLRRQGYLPERTPEADSLNVDATIEQFLATLKLQLERIDERGAQIEQELHDLRAQRAQVVEHIERLSA